MSAILSNDSLPNETLPTLEQPNKQPKRKPNKPAQPKKTKAEREQEKAEREANLARENAQKKTLFYASLASFAVATALLALSVIHLQEAICYLTGSNQTLSCLLAIGIDLGMLCCEVAVIVTVSTETKRWASSYIIAAAIASAALNAIAFSLHGPWEAAVPLGILIPFLVLALGKVGGSLYLQSQGRE